MSNLFEAQAKQDQRMVAALREMLGIESALQFIAKAELAQCKRLVDALADRVSDLEGVAFGLEDVAEEMQQYVSLSPCACGQCDSCRAARSDEHHDRKVDARLMGAR